MNDVPDVTVIMSALNAVTTVERAIRSIVKQSISNWEFVIIDDGSTDETTRKVRSFEDPRIRLVTHSARCGLAARLNEAVELARGRYIARMDADDVAYPIRLEHQLEFLLRNPAVDLVGAAVMAFRQSEGPIGVMDVSTSHSEICVHPEIGFGLPHPTWLGKAEFFRRFPYKPSARRAQDQDLLLRAFGSARFANVPEVLLAYRQERVTAAHQVRGRIQYCRSMWELWSRNGDIERLARGLVIQTSRAAAIAPLLLLGNEDIVLRRRYRPARPDELRAWQTCMELTHSD